MAWADVRSWVTNELGAEVPSHFDPKRALGGLKNWVGLCEFHASENRRCKPSHTVHIHADCRRLTSLVACVLSSLERLLRNRINDICLNTTDLVFAQPLDIIGFNPCCRFRPHLVDCPTEPRSEGNGPPIFC